MTSNDTTCPGCGRIFKGERGLRAHQSRPFAACRPAPASAEPAMAQDKATEILPDGQTSPNLQAWATEHDSFVVWGTHDVDVATPVLREFIEANFSAEDIDELLLEREELSNGGFYWGRPELPDEETWAETDYSFKAVDGWVPYMVVSR
ncbi:hypothetical protein ABH924_003282 [Arthrobacter sp. GAS37]|uniref:hypothetical protein n=1 Tax=Arthrobacter sp. GAS37 TaxID=3156261 RepID=UPI003836511D